MATPDFMSMTLEEIEAWNVVKKQQILELQEEYRASNFARAIKVQESRVAEARKQMQILADKSGRTLIEEAEFWQNRLTTDGDFGRWMQSNLVLGKDARAGIPQS